jgi:hypothetical protein
MVFFSYAPATKVAFVCMSLKGYLLLSICNMLGYSVSPQSLCRWKQLYETTQAIIRDPTGYQKRGRKKLLYSEDSEFMIQLV